MKRIFFYLLLAALSACGQSDASKQSDVPTVDELTANPARLKELREQCKTDRLNLGEVLCSRVAEATRKRFYGDGKVPYTPSDASPKF